MRVRTQSFIFSIRKKIMRLKGLNYVVNINLGLKELRVASTYRRLIATS